MTGELLITLWDFVEEDRTRLLPATERATHTLLTLNYGVILALLAPTLAACPSLSDLRCQRDAGRRRLARHQPGGRLSGVEGTATHARIRLVRVSI